MQDRVFPLGNVEISNDILATIAAKAANSVEGVLDVAGRDLARTTHAKSRVHGKLVMRIKDSFIYIDIPVILQYGYHVQKVATEVQRRVKEDIEMMTGLYVVEINVLVEDLVTKAD